VVCNWEDFSFCMEMLNVSVCSASGDDSESCVLGDLKFLDVSI